MRRASLKRAGVALVAAGAVVGAFAAASFGGGAAAAPATAPKLSGTVGPGFTITLKRGGSRVTSLKAGSYRFVIADRSTIHDFVLEKEHGGTFEKELTNVPSTGTKTVAVRLTKGEWKFYCRPHEAQMFGKFDVT